MGIIKLECVPPRGWNNKCQLQLRFNSSGPREQRALRRTFFFHSPCCISPEDRIIMNSFGREIHGEHVKHRGRRAASGPRWVRAEGFAVQNADVDSPRRQQRIITVLPPHPPPNEWRSEKMLFTPALSIRSWATSVSVSRSQASSSAVPYVQPCHNHQLSTDECPLPHFTWKTRRALHC